MTRIFNFGLGVLAITQGVAQYLAATGRVELDFWPFVQTPNRSLRFAAAGLAVAIGMVLIASAVLG